MFMSYAWAQAADAAARPSLIEQFFPFVVIIIVFFFLVIRPAQKRQKAQAGMLEGLKRGDSVLTSGGILGTIEGLTDQFVILQIADGVKVRMLKTHIASQAAGELEKK